MLNLRRNHSKVLLQSEPKSVLGGPQFLFKTPKAKGGGAMLLHRFNFLLLTTQRAGNGYLRSVSQCDFSVYYKDSVF